MANYHVECYKNNLFFNKDLAYTSFMRILVSCSFLFIHSCTLLILFLYIDHMHWLIESAGAVRMISSVYCFFFLYSLSLCFHWLPMVYLLAHLPSEIFYFSPVFCLLPFPSAQILNNICDFCLYLILLYGPFSRAQYIVGIPIS